MDYRKIANAYLKDKQANGMASGTIENASKVLDSFEESMTRNGYTEPSVQAVSDWKLEQTERGIKITTLSLYMGQLKTFFEWALDMEYIDRNPVKKSLLPPSKSVQKVKAKEYTKILTPDEFNRLIHTTLEGRLEIGRKLSIILGTTGLRNSELRDLKVRNIDFNTSTLKVEHGKGDKERVVPFPNIVKDFLLEMTEGKQPNDYVVLYRGEPIDRTVLSLLVNDVFIKVCGRTDIRTHALRHFFASYMLSEGGNLSDISKVLGHASTTITEQVYAKEFDRNASINRIKDKTSEVWG